MAGNSITLFGSDPPTGANSYIQDAFSDITDTPSNNTGWSSTISSNPMNNLYGNDDAPRFGPKTLWVQDLVLEPNRSNWINGQPTYRIIWNEPFPSAQGYVYGDIQLIRRADQVSVQIKSLGSGFGVGGVFSRCMALVAGNTTTPGSASCYVDGVSNGVTVDFSDLNAAQPNVSRTYFATVMDTAGEAYNIHDFRLTPNQATVMQIEGVIIYSQNPSLSIDQFPGVTYNNKSRFLTTSNTTLSVGGATLFGSVATIWKNSIGGYSMSVLPLPGISSIIVTGSSGTNLVTVQTGQGASFSALDGLFALSSVGSTPYLGSILSISTDTLTVSPTLPFGLSGFIYRYFQSGPSMTINSSLNILAMTFGSTEMSKIGIFGGVSNLVTQGQTGLFCYTDPLLRFYLWGQGLGMTVMNGYPALSILGTTTSWFQCDGYFSSADLEWVGPTGTTMVVGGSFSINGNNTWPVSANGSSGIYRQSVMMDAPTGWNSFSYSWGIGSAALNTNTAISRIGLYQRARDTSASFGILGKFDVLPNFVPATTNGTYIAPGIFQRLYADQLMLRGPWTRTVGTTIPGGVMYQGSGTSCALSFNYFGTNFALHGMSLGKGASINFSIDGSANIGNAGIGSIQVAGSTFHSVSLSILGGTLSLFAADTYRLYGDMKNLQTFTGVTSLPANPIPIITRWMPYAAGTTGFGTVTNANAWWRRNATDCEIRGAFVAGTPINTNYAVFLPPGLVADGSYTSNFPAAGIPQISVGSFYSTNLVASGGPTGMSLAISALLSTPYAPYLNFAGAGNNGFQIIGTTAIMQPLTTGGGAIVFTAKVTIAGWEVDR